MLSIQAHNRYLVNDTLQNEVIKDYFHDLLRLLRYVVSLIDYHDAVLQFYFHLLPQQVVVGHEDQISVVVASLVLVVRAHPKVVPKLPKLLDIERLMRHTRLSVLILPELARHAEVSTLLALLLLISLFHDLWIHAQLLSTAQQDGLWDVSQLS